jgi:hypothetical protein
MKKYCASLFLWVGTLIYSFCASAQEVGEKQLIWERNLIDLGAVMAENGEVTSEFFFVNKADFPIFIEEIQTDCGCTTASYTTDTLSQDKIGSVKISYSPTDRGGPFSKMILVKTNIDSQGDSLFLEGYNLPYPENINNHYSHKVGDLGFSSSIINMGNVFTNEPKVKQVDFYNYRDYPILLNEVRTLIPDHIQVSFSPHSIAGNSRGILELRYDGAAKADLGFMEDKMEIALVGKDEPVIPLNVIATVHEYFAPVHLDEVDKIPKLALSEMEVDLNRISGNVPISKIITLTNIGAAPVNIRKIVSNCDCLVFSLEKNDLAVDETVDLVFTFDPKGRRGIEHKTLTIFSNDPLNPTRTVVIKSRIQ